MQQAEHPLAEAHMLAPSEAAAFCGESLERLLDLQEAYCGDRTPHGSPTVPLARALVTAQVGAEAGDVVATSEACLRGIGEIALLAALQRGIRRRDAHRVAADAVLAEREWQRTRVAGLIRRGA